LHINLQEFFQHKFYKENFFKNIKRRETKPSVILGINSSFSSDTQEQTRMPKGRKRRKKNYEESSHE
jgi:hypothetical protein